MKKYLLAVAILSAVAFPVCAEDYFRETWFEYPDPTTAPRVTARCVQEASLDVPCPTWSEPFRMCRGYGCTGHAYTTELLRVAPTFVVSGPSSGEEAVKRAVQGIVAVCAANGTVAAKAAAAVTPSPEPGARIAAGIGAGITSFKACIATANATAVAAGIVNQLEFKVDSPTHWAPL